jgi:hypothetical protein
MNTQLQQLLEELRRIDRRCKGFVTFFYRSPMSWAQCSVCRHKFFDGDPDYKAVLDAAQSTGKVQQCSQERAETLPARVKLLERIVEALVTGEDNG